MEVIRKYMKINNSGSLLLERLPFYDGELVEVLVLPISKANSNLSQRWYSMFKELQSNKSSDEISDNDILEEISNYRKGV